MDPNTQALMMGAAGASAAGPATYVEDVFSTWLYAGNSSTQTITNGIDLSGKGGMVWCKPRNASNTDEIVDTARGINSGLAAIDSRVAASSSEITSFNNNGYTLGFITGLQNFNARTFASWTFRKAAKFFDVVTWTGNGTDGRQIAHNLGSAPGCVIIKRTDSAIGWAVYHRSRTTTYGELNSTNAFATSQLGGYNMQEVFGNSSAVILPDASNITVARFSPTNASGATYVAYLFAHDAGGFGDSGNDSVVKCGTFTCDGSGNVGTVDLGWEPQWILTKKTNGTQNWYQWDNMRGWALTTSSTLSPNLSDAEVAMGGTSYLYPTATGFAGSGNFFGANAQVAYIAIRRGPMKTPTDATKVFSAAIGNNTGSAPGFTSGFPVDFAIWGKDDTASVLNRAYSRLSGGFMVTAGTGGESPRPAAFAYQNGWFDTAINLTLGNSWMFRRAPGFFDVVAWTASASTSITHGLGVTPELIIAKSRSVAGESWTVYTQAGGRGNVLFLNAINGNVGIADYWGTSGPTATTFGVAASGSSNNVGDMIAYLFATLTGISKVGSYTGTGTTLSIDCGFTNGARFVLIKRTDSTGDWYVWDTARGIVSGNDPYLLLNSTAAEVTNTDYIDPLSSGFQISSTAPAGINANGGIFLYLAIA